MTLAEAPIEAAPALDVLWETAPPASAAVRGAGMPPELRRRYGGDLVIPLRPDRPTVVANFVSTIDGVVALGSGELSGGGWVSGFHEPDRFVMAILRAVADVVVIGARTLRGSTSHRWTPEHVQPRLAGVLADWRRAMGLAPHPTTVVVSASGEIPTSHAGLNDPSVPVIVATSPSGAGRLRHRGGLPANVAVESIGTGAPLTGAEILGVVSRLGARVVLTEGGPHVLAGLVGADLLDELFLTLAPQVVGRLGDARIGLVEGIALAPADARWHELASVRRSDQHLFLRYRRASSRPNEKGS
jgi:riboflavin biosynthesis pyrimidine reductase